MATSLPSRCLGGAIALLLLNAVPTWSQPPGNRPNYYYFEAPTRTSFNIRTTVSAPDGGSVLIGGLSGFREARSEYGVPVLGRLPIAGRPFRNVGYGREIDTTQVRVHVRIIDLAEEEYRQTGYSPRR